MSIFSSGFKPKTVKIYNTAAKAVASGAVTIINNLNTLDSNIGDEEVMYSSALQDRLTAKVAGKYIFIAHANNTGVSGTGTYFTRIGIVKNGSTSAYATLNMSLQNKDAFSKYFECVTPVVWANANDYFSVTIEQNSGGSFSYFVDFSAIRLG